jgi:hypothetical protein
MGAGRHRSGSPSQRAAKARPAGEHHFATAEGCGTTEMMGRSNISKPVV